MSFVDRSQSPEHGGDSPRPCPPGPPPSPANGSRAKSRQWVSWRFNLDACEFRAWLIKVHEALLTSWNIQWTFFSQRWVHAISNPVLVIGNWNRYRWQHGEHQRRVGLGGYAGLEDRDTVDYSYLLSVEKSWLWECFFFFSLVTPLKLSSSVGLDMGI